MINVYVVASTCFVQAEDGIRDLVRSRGLGDVYKRQGVAYARSAVGPFALAGYPRLAWL